LLNAETLPRAGKGRLIIAMVVLLLLIAGVNQAETQKTSETKPAQAPSNIVAIPLAEVAARATEVSNLLRVLRSRFVPIHEIERIPEKLNEVSRRITLQLWRLMTILREEPTFQILQTEQEL